MSGNEGQLAGAGDDADEQFRVTPVGNTVDPCPGVPRLTLHVDADRDGKVDDSTEGLDVWTWGKGKKGAVILCNNDDDEDDAKRKKKCDNQNDVVDTYDEPDIAPLVIRKSPKIQDLPAGLHRGPQGVEQRPDPDLRGPRPGQQTDHQPIPGGRVRVARREHR
jgi:hypothetical protein